MKYRGTGFMAGCIAGLIILVTYVLTAVISIGVPVLIVVGILKLLGVI
jgi:hypothetical protein